MYFIDTINSNNQEERVYFDTDVYVSVEEPSLVEKNNILLELLKLKAERNKERDIKAKNKRSNKQTKVVVSKSASTYKNGKRVPIFNEKRASDLTIFDDGTYDYNEVKSQDYNDEYFDFKELKALL